MLRKIAKKADRTYAYYYDLTFDETVKRHTTKIAPDFTPKQMKDWFIPHDLLGIENEKSISDNVTKDHMVQLVLADITKTQN